MQASVVQLCCKIAQNGSLQAFVALQGLTNNEVCNTPFLTKVDVFISGLSLFMYENIHKR